MAVFERVVVVTKKTALEELVYRLNSRAQARFYLEQQQVSFTEYEQADAQYQQALQFIRQHLPPRIKQQFIERDFLPTYQFGPDDLVVTVGPDGLVINTAKYLADQPILALNPDPARIDGALIPFPVTALLSTLERVLEGRYRVTRVSMVKATLNDGQEIHAVNDLFIGQSTHRSARYTLEFAGRREPQSSSGIIVSTGAGCTGWLRSITQGAWQVARYFAGSTALPADPASTELGWEANNLWFAVREPFPSKTSQASTVFGQIAPGEELLLTSQMPEGGVIFSDGIENDYLAFNSGAIARVALATRKASLIVNR